MTRCILPLFFLSAVHLWAQSPDATAPVATSGLTPAPAIADDRARVSVLGYHDFSSREEDTAMRINTAKFRKQMERIRQFGITVISMDAFAAWKRGELSIPEKSILLTFDDGWKSVYEEAFPILKEFKYPFTLYLYKNYVDGGGKALTTPMIRDMIKHGATIGSHSVSHPYPVTFKNRHKKGTDAYDVFLRKEIGESKRFLESKFRVDADTYSYPGGYVTEEMLPIIKEFGYRFAFTVEPGKAQRSTPDLAIPRFMILGNYDKIFEFATTFRDPNDAPVPQPDGAIADRVQPPPYPVFPEPGAIINSRLPEISADLSKVDGLDPESLHMRVSGFAHVPASFDPETKKVSWQVNRRLRHPSCQVIVTWKDLDGASPQKPLRWSFQIDREAAYLLEGE